MKRMLAIVLSAAMVFTNIGHTPTVAYAASGNSVDFMVRNTFPFKKPILVFLKKDMPYKELEKTMPSPSISHRPSLGNPPRKRRPDGSPPPFARRFLLFLSR